MYFMAASYAQRDVVYVLHTTIRSFIQFICRAEFGNRELPASIQMHRAPSYKPYQRNPLRNGCNECTRMPAVAARD